MVGESGGLSTLMVIIGRLGVCWRSRLSPMTPDVLAGGLCDEN
jgi:hypothetical protein